MTGRATCARCEGPREADAPNKSWCRKCYNEYHRNRYGKGNKEERLQKRIEEFGGRPGICDFCDIQEPMALVLVSYGTEWQQEWGRGKPIGLACQWCRQVLETLRTSRESDINRLKYWLKYLSKNRLDAQQITITEG